MNIQQAKAKFRITNVLQTMGYMPTKIKGNEYWYISPLRDEKTPSFCVNIKKDCFNDFGASECGGDIIALLALMLKTDTKGVLKYLTELDNSFSFSQQKRQQPITEKKETTIEMLKVKPLENKALLDYAGTRWISNEVIKKFCVEAYYKINEKNYFAIAFKNDSGGYELRNKWFKGCTSKDVTYLNNGSEKLMIFEGFFDFLSSERMAYLEKDDLPTNILVLNSTSNYKKSLDIVKKHKFLYLFLDSDEEGKALTKKYQKLGIPYLDYSYIYSGAYKDFNEWFIAQEITITPHDIDNSSSQNKNNLWYEQSPFNFFKPKNK